MNEYMLNSESFRVNDTGYEEGVNNHWSTAESDEWTNYGWPHTANSGSGSAEEAMEYANVNMIRETQTSANITKTDLDTVRNEILSAIETKFATVSHQVDQITSQFNFINSTLDQRIDERIETRIDVRVEEHLDRSLYPELMAGT